MLGNFLRRLQETGPRYSGQCAADADPTDARLGQLGHRCKVTAGQHVDRFWRDRGDYRSNVGHAAEAGRVEAIGPGLGESDKAADRLTEIGTTDDEAFGAAGENHPRSTVFDGSSGGLDPFDRE